MRINNISAADKLMVLQSVEDYIFEQRLIEILAIGGIGDMGRNGNNALRKRRARPIVGVAEANENSRRPDNRQRLGQMDLMMQRSSTTEEMCGKREEIQALLCPYWLKSK